MSTTVRALIALLVFATFCSNFVVTAAELRTEHTYQLAEGEARPAATIEDAAMLVGSWEGTAFGSHIEEVGNPPSAGSMVGLFKVYRRMRTAFARNPLSTSGASSLAP